MSTEAPGPADARPRSATTSPTIREPRRVGARKPWLRRCIIGIFLTAFVGVGVLLFAEHETAKPEFCGSCHIMKPYYASRHADMHGGRLAVACVECHYAPGEKTTVKAKLRGLSQVTSYISGRYGATRPRAHVDNRSCTTSKCHGDLAFMTKELKLGTVTFVHAKHLKLDEKKLQATQRELGELTDQLRKQLGEQRLNELDEIAARALPADERAAGYGRLLAAWPVKIEPAKLTKYAELHHREVRLAQLADLQCTNCHSYASPFAANHQSPLVRAHAHDGTAHHFTVKTNSCITCHFNNEEFNHGTASCLTCHQLPTKDILVHKELSSAESAKLKTPELGSKPIKINHQLMVERKVNCMACHADVATEDATVSRRDCERCHDRPEYFQRWQEPFTLDLVKHYHATHVPEQHAKCLDCHNEIQHQLVRGKDASGQPEFLSSAMSHCQQCHPNQHAEQVKLLSGTGGIGVKRGEPNLMFGAHTNCFGCHTAHTATKDGKITSKPTVAGCVACHGDKHSDKFTKWKQGVELVMIDANEAYDKARKQLLASKDLGDEVRRQVTALLDAALEDLRLVKRGNGVHNMLYSVDLLDSVTQRCQKAMTLMRQQNKKP